MFPDFSYEADMGTEPLYNNDTKGIVTIEDTESNGVRRIILQIDPTVVAAEAIYYSLIIKNKECLHKFQNEFVCVQKNLTSGYCLATFTASG